MLEKVSAAAAGVVIQERVKVVANSAKCLFIKDKTPFPGSTCCPHWAKSAQ